MDYDHVNWYILSCRKTIYGERKKISLFKIDCNFWLLLDLAAHKWGLGCVLQTFVDAF